MNSSQKIHNENYASFSILLAEYNSAIVGFSGHDFN